MDANFTQSITYSIAAVVARLAQLPSRHLLRRPVGLLLFVSPKIINLWRDESLRPAVLARLIVVYRLVDEPSTDLRIVGGKCTTRRTSTPATTP